MATPLPTISTTIDDYLRPESAEISPSHTIPTIQSTDLADGPSLASTLKLPDSDNAFLSPQPSITPTPTTFQLADLLDENGTLQTFLGAEYGKVDIVVAADGSHIDTTSGAVAREIKRRYDQIYGVGPTVRSPYTIMGFVNQHGRSMCRVSHRDAAAPPGASAAEVEERNTLSKASDPAGSPRTRRRSRLSGLHFPPVMNFSRSTISSNTRPPISSTSTASSGKKLRKTRSIPDMPNPEPIVTNAPTFAVAGRGHSQSVTAVDNTRPSAVFYSERKIDFFADLMDWFTPPSSASSNFSAHSLFNHDKISAESDKPRAIIANPFGYNVTYNVPKVPTGLPAPSTRLLREMQSFESGLTARQDHPGDVPESDTSTPIELDNDSSRPPSAIRLSAFSLPPVMPEDLAGAAGVESELESDSETDPEPPAPFAPSTESLRLSQHNSKVVFDVLQTYRGLPVFEEANESDTVIKLSLANDESAAPRDDPRFVLWGESMPDSDADDYYFRSRESFTGTSGNVSNSLSSSMASRRRSSQASRMRSPATSSSSRTPVVGKRVVLAATIERWIAQLTSELNYDEMLSFFLTYRAYINGVDLCHLLISRFEWALQLPSSTHDEKVRRIVRVRTFVAIRYWMLTFFAVDFVPNRELRLLVADWLNSLLQDPKLKNHIDGVDIVRRLIKVAKECKRQHLREEDQPKTSAPETAPVEPAPVEHVLGKSFAEATRKAKSDVESELDLDFLPDEAKEDLIDTITGFPSDPANAHLHAGQANMLIGARPTATMHPSQLNILQRTDHAPGPESQELIHHPSAGLTIKHSTLSRAFVRTITRLGRWKRVLNPKAGPRPSSVGSVGACGAGPGAFDIDEISEARDLLTSQSELQKYLGIVTPAPPKLVLPAAPVTAPAVASESNVVDATTSTAPDDGSPAHTGGVPEAEVQEPAAQDSDSVHSIPVVTLNAAQKPSSDAPTFVQDEDQASLNHDIDLLQEPHRPESFRSTSTDSFGDVLTTERTFPGHHNQWGIDVMSIDDMDFSDTSSMLPTEEDPAFPPGLRKPIRKLPNRRDFEFVRHSEASSMGVTSHDQWRNSAASSQSESAPVSGGGLQGPIQKWQMKSLQQTFENVSNDEEDTGDVEAALRRLEGQINPKVLQEKAEKVDGWVRNMQERMANGDYDYESSLYSEDEPEGFFDETDQSSTLGHSDTPDTDDHQEATEEGIAVDSAQTPLASQTVHQVPQGEATNGKPHVEDAIPLEILESRMPPSPDASTLGLVNPPTIGAVLASKFVNPEGPRVHRSFVMNSPADVIAAQFAMIDRELFMGVKFEELVIDDWAECEDITVHDWTTYLKERATWKAESRHAEKCTALAAVRARFNLIVSFVISEIVLTSPHERPNVVAKFIRIAWKSYSISNFNTLTAIITALQNDWVARAMRKPGWSRLPIFETRVYRDLKQFTVSTGDFKFMRQVIDAIVDCKPLDESTRAASVVSTGDSQGGKSKNAAVPSNCVPFIGIYLSQLHRLNKLPALIDPTAPNSIIGIDPVTANFDAPAHPEVFAALVPLPPSMRLEPLINVHKQRRIAEVIKSLVAGQHLASKVQHPIDKRVFNKCLRLGGLSNANLQKALALYSD